VFLEIKSKLCLKANNIFSEDEWNGGEGLPLSITNILEQWV
jgi:hypothetical protein